MRNGRPRFNRRIAIGEVTKQHVIETLRLSPLRLSAGRWSENQINGGEWIGGNRKGVKHCDAILRGPLDQGLDQRSGLNRGSAIRGATKNACDWKFAMRLSVGRWIKGLDQWWRMESGRNPCILYKTRTFEINKGFYGSGWKNIYIKRIGARIRGLWMYENW